MTVFCLSLVRRLLLFFALLIISAAIVEGIQISFPQFSANNSAMMRPFGDVQYYEDHQSFILNAESAATSSPTCSLLLYNGSTDLLFRDIAGSFSTSFTFKFTVPEKQPVWDDFNGSQMTSSGSSLYFGMTNTLYTARLRSRINQTSTCSYVLGMKGFLGLSFQTTYNYNKGEPSNNFIALSDGNNQPIFQPGSTYNLCGNHTHCSYLANGSSFTAWIDYTPQKTLEVRLLENSFVQTPLKPILVFPNYELSPELGEYISLHFTGSSAKNGIVSHEILDWSFSSNGTLSKSRKSSRTKWIALIYAVGGIIVTTLALYILCKLWHARSWKQRALCDPSGIRVFLYKELRKATKNFSENEKVGSGAFGTVYRGSFGNSFIAVKRINYESKYAESTFHAEISSLAVIRHRNVVQLQGWCHERNQFMLIYNYMPNGNLNEWLHKSGRNGKHNPLLNSCKLRERILQEVAAALEYLHSDCIHCILHRDIKSSNIMLDENFKAHIGDFGLARLMDHKRHDRTTMAAGTLGYMAPELPHTGKATKESDVYSYGILVLEVVCGRQPLDLKAQDPENTVLLHCVWRAQEAGMLLDMVDPKLLQNLPSSKVEICRSDESIYVMPTPLDTSKHPHDLNDCNMCILTIEDDIKFERILKNLLHLGLMCCLPNPKLRPTMEEVVQILQKVNDIDNIGDIITSLPPLPKAKPLWLYSSIEFSQTIGLSQMTKPKVI